MALRSYDVMVTEQAEGQIREIAEYLSLELSAPLAANRLLDSLLEGIGSLGELPQRISLVDEEPWRSRGVRKLVIVHYLACFWVDEESSRVQVIAVVYAVRD